jgi:hypothetical protein
VGLGGKVHDGVDLLLSQGVADRVGLKDIALRDMKMSHKRIKEGGGPAAERLVVLI